MDDQNNLNNNPNQNPTNPLDQNPVEQNTQLKEENSTINQTNTSENPLQEKENTEVPSFTQMDSSTTPPPLIPTVEEISNNDQGTNSPNLDISSAVSIEDKPKKKIGGKMIATILGILVLVGGIGAGVMLLNQQQDIREKASSTTGETSSTCSSGTCRYGITDCGVYNEVKTGTCAGGTCCKASTTPKPTTTSTPTATSKPTSTPNTSTCESYGGKCYSSDNLPTCSNLVSLSQYNSSCSSGRVCLKCGGSASCIPDGQCMTSSTSCCNGSYSDTSCGYSIPVRCGTKPVSPTSTATSKPTSAPSTTPTPSSTVQCLNIKAYDTSWNSLSATNLQSLKAGNIVRFTVSGTATSGTFDKAKFTINSVSLGETTSKKPSSEEFYTEYTIPSGTTSFTINAQIHHTTKGWI